MNMSLSWSLYDRREEVAKLAALMLGAVILLASHTLLIQHEEPVKEEPISLVIIAPPPAPEKIVVPQPVVPVQPVKQKIIEQPQEALPEAVIPAPVQQPILEKKEVITPVKPEPVATPKSNGIAEGQFAQDVRSRVEHRKVYPDRARELGMEGEVEVLYEIDRGGNLLRAEIVSTSGYKLLDQAALKAVKSASYKSFPVDAWVGSGSKEFRTKLVFSIS